MNQDQLKELEPHGSALFPLRVHEFISDPTVAERVAMHWHPECELLVVTVGAALLHLNGASYQIKKGDIAIIQPDQLHAMTAAVGAPFGFFAVVFDPVFLQSAVPDSIQQQYLAEPLRVPTLLPLTSHLTADLYQNLLNIRALYYQQPAAFMLQIKGYLFLAWANLVQLADHTHSQPLTGGVAVDETKAVIAYIQQHYSQPLTLTILASHFNLSKSHLCRMFKQTTKMALTDYINATRIGQSTILLQNTDDAIGTIAGLVGFNNISYFNKIFQRRMRLTPSAYRQTIRSTTEN